MNDKHSNQDYPFEVTDRKATVFTKISDKLFLMKVRRHVRQSNRKDPAMQLYKINLKERSGLITNPSVKQKIKEHLESGKSLTALDCLRLFHSTELRSRIAELRKVMTIHDDWVTTSDGKRHKRYFC